MHSRLCVETETTYYYDYAYICLQTFHIEARALHAVEHINTYSVLFSLIICKSQYCIRMFCTEWAKRGARRECVCLHHDRHESIKIKYKATYNILLLLYMLYTLEPMLYSIACSRDTVSHNTRQHPFVIGAWLGGVVYLYVWVLSVRETVTTTFCARVS